MFKNLVDELPARVAVGRRSTAQRDYGSAELSASRRREGFEQDCPEPAEEIVADGASTRPALPGRHHAVLEQLTIGRVEFVGELQHARCGCGR
jgi:hypothetical protein